MKIVIALTFLGVLAFAVGESPPVIEPQRDCTNVSGKKDLDVNKYFHSRWYLTNLQSSTEPTGVCQESKSEVLPDGTVKHLIAGYGKGRKPEFVELDCRSNTKEVSNGRTTLHCTFLTEGTNMKPFELVGTVVETDYDTFAVFHACGKRNDIMTSEKFLVLSRNKDEPTDPKLKETLKNLGLNFENFVARKSVTCLPVPNF